MSRLLSALKSLTAVVSVAPVAPLLIVAALIIPMLPSLLLAADLHAEAQEHLQQGHYTEAQLLLRRLLVEDPSNEILYIQYAFAYEQQGDYQEAINILNSGLPRATHHKAQFHYNLGNGYFALRNYNEATQAYSRAIRDNSSYLPPYVNRANLRIRQRDYVGALNDYSYYITQAPNGEQNGEVRAMIAILRSLLEAEERRQRAEIEAQEKLLRDALQALENADQEGGNVQSEGEEIKDFDNELDIVN